MFKLVIVDDEKLDREGLQAQIDWKALNIDTVMTAKNGYEGIKIIETLQPDILISDIKMPGMSGLTLAEQALALLPGLKVIFTSGFDDFEYVRTALKMDAFEYILKPVDTGELLSALKQAIGEIIRERKADEEAKHLLERVNETKPLLLQKFWRELLYTGTDRTRIAEKLKDFDITLTDGCLITLLCEIDDYKTQITDKGPELNHLTGQLIGEMAAKLVTEGCAAEYVQLEEARFVVVLSFEPPLPAEHTRDLARHAAKSIIQAVKEHLDISLTVGVGCAVSTLAELSHSYDECCKAVLQKMFVGKGGVLFYYPKTGSRGTIIDIQNIGNQLMQSITAIDMNKAVYYIDNLFDSIEAGNIYDKRYVQNCCFNIISRIEITLTDMNETLDAIFGENESLLWEKLIRFETILDIRQWLKNVFRAVLEYLDNKRSKKNRRIIEQLLEYIEGHYSEELTLKQAAAYFYYSPNHLGYLFKEETGQGFTEYLTELRMKKAAELLTTSQLKMYEIAGRVGYKNISSFINQFKLSKSMTPTEYRETYV